VDHAGILPPAWRSHGTPAAAGPRDVGRVLERIAAVRATLARVDVDLASWWPLASQLGVGLVAGFAAGYALKKVGKLLAVAVGLLFVVVQVLAWQGFLTVNWGEVEARVDPLLEVDSLESGWRALVDVLTYNLAFAGAFVPGLILGIRRG
jgi:uncharacterized membrane protein (Fun14 family)